MNADDIVRMLVDKIYNDGEMHEYERNRTDEYREKLRKSEKARARIEPWVAYLEQALDPDQLEQIRQDYATEVLAKLSNGGPACE